MSRRAELEHEVALAEKRLKDAPHNTPADLKKIWEDEFVGLSLELNNLDEEEDEIEDEDIKDR